MSQSEKIWHEAFVLFSRRYRETSLLIDLFTESLGKISVVARGACTMKSPLKGLLQAFTPLRVMFSGKGGLLNLTQIETPSAPFMLKGDALWSGLYLNELLFKLLQMQDPYPKLYAAYAETLNLLAQANFFEPILRSFEFQLLAELGYALPLKQEAENGHVIEADCFYRFHFQNGFNRVSSEFVKKQDPYIFLGEHLLLFSDSLFHSEEVLREAKRLTRLVFTGLLGKKSLKTREFLIGLARQKWLEEEVIHA